MILAAPPQFGPNGVILALDRDGGMVKLRVTLPAADRGFPVSGP